MPRQDARRSRGAAAVADRRRLLKGMAGGLAAAGLAAALPCCATPPRSVRPRRLIVVRFGGGVRYDDLFGPEERCLAPYLRSLCREGTLYSRVFNDNLTRHDTATRYLLTGRYGDRLDSNERGLENLEQLAKAPLLFERYRKARGAPRHKVLAAGVPEHSNDPEHGERFGAMTFASERGPGNGSSISGDPGLGLSAHVTMANRRLLRIAGQLDSMLVPASHEARRRFLVDAAHEDLAGATSPAPELDGVTAAALGERLLADRPFVQAEEADHWLMELALGALRRHRPDLAVIAYSTPDLAHRGSWQTYAGAVRRIDLELARLNRCLAEDAYYRGSTTLLVTSDCGRGESSFHDHRAPFDDPAHRRLFLLALGVGQTADLLIEQRAALVDVGATAAALLDCGDGAEGLPLLEVLG